MTGISFISHAAILYNKYQTYTNATSSRTNVSVPHSLRTTGLDVLFEDTVRGEGRGMWEYGRSGQVDKAEEKVDEKKKKIRLTF